MPSSLHGVCTTVCRHVEYFPRAILLRAKRGNEMLGLTGEPFWQDESYDHLVRNEREFGKIRSYLEENPVRAGLVREAMSIDGRARRRRRGRRLRTRGSAPLRTKGVRPTNHQ